MTKVIVETNLHHNKVNTDPLDLLNRTALKHFIGEVQLQCIPWKLVSIYPC